MADEVRGYRDLIVWQKSMALVEATYRVVDDLPSSEQFGLSMQMRKAAVSAPSNIAEGHRREGRGEYRYHLSVARASIAELETQLLLCVRLKFIMEESAAPLLSETDEISRMLKTLIRKLS